MDAVKLGSRQIFLMKKESLTKRVQDFYASTKNNERLIQFMVAILVRNSLSQGIITEQLKELIREVYLTAEPNDTMRRYSPFFKRCFSGSEWKGLIKKLFKNESNYFANTEEARFYNNYLENEGTLKNHREDLIYHVESVFEDAEGKKHKLTIPDTDPTKSEEQTVNILRTLSLLTVFENAGVRKFVEYVSYKTPGLTIASAHNSRKEKKAAQASQTKNVTEAAAQAPQQEKEQKQFVQSIANKKETGQLLPADCETHHTQAHREELHSEAQDDTRDSVPETNGNDSAPPMSSPTSDGKKGQENLQPATKKKPNKTAELPKRPDTSYMRYGKSEAQIEEERENKRLQREADRKNGKKKKRKKRK
ncbi:hypothetical protein [Enterococcus sp. AZ196]|uniref:hypothetical protein n=1 Tax=Enterococcus sp. AZ196 TaxID=2774659 RepID=UPI003D2A8BDE